MTIPTHTATPWRAVPWKYSDGTEKLIIQNDKDAVLEVLDLWCMDERTAERDANAAFIVKAANCHVDLLAALTKAAAILDQLQDQPDKAAEIINQGYFGHALAIGRSAIASATAETPKELSRTPQK
jgi:hypothetical protein